MVNSAIENLAKTIADPDLYRLFENTFPNTLDTAIKWYGFGSRAPDDIRAFIITGDIDAMWLRDSANQLLSYASLFKKTKGDDLIDYLFRGVIHQQARYCQNLALMANCGDCCVLLFCGRESLACRVPYCQAGYIREWLQLLI